jgi:hypothetical protein
LLLWWWYLQVLIGNVSDPPFHPTALLPTGVLLFVPQNKLYLNITARMWKMTFTGKRKNRNLCPVCPKKAKK